MIGEEHSAVVREELKYTMKLILGDWFLNGFLQYDSCCCVRSEGWLRYPRTQQTPAVAI